MEKSQKSVLMLSMITACLMLVAIVGVGYAAFTVGVRITGSGEVVNSKWEIKFENLQPVSLTSKNTPVTAKQLTAPTLADTSITNFKVQLQTPGDSVKYTFDVHNYGTFDAKLSSFTKAAKPTCTGAEGATTATTDAANVCKYLTYTLKYANGNAVAQNDTLNHGETKTLELTLTYAEFDNQAELPKEDVTISGLDINMNYSQVQTS